MVWVVSDGGSGMSLHVGSVDGAAAGVRDVGTGWGELGGCCSPWEEWGGGGDVEPGIGRYGFVLASRDPLLMPELKGWVRAVLECMGVGIPP